MNYSEKKGEKGERKKGRINSFGEIEIYIKENK